VAHGRQEIALGAAGRFGGVLGDAQFRRLLLNLVECPAQGSQRQHAQRNEYADTEQHGKCRRCQRAEQGGPERARNLQAADRVTAVEYRRRVRDQRRRKRIVAGGNQLVVAAEHPAGFLAAVGGAAIEHHQQAIGLEFPEIGIAIDQPGDQAAVDLALGGESRVEVGAREDVVCRGQRQHDGQTDTGGNAGKQALHGEWSRRFHRLYDTRWPLASRMARPCGDLTNSMNCSAAPLGAPRVTIASDLKCR
jgi:hypothetical protein